MRFWSFALRFIASGATLWIIQASLYVDKDSISLYGDCRNVSPILILIGNVVVSIYGDVGNVEILSLYLLGNVVVSSYSNSSCVVIALLPLARIVKTSKYEGIGCIVIAILILGIRRSVEKGRSASVSHVVYFKLEVSTIGGRSLRSIIVSILLDKGFVAMALLMGINIVESADLGLPGLVLIAFLRDEGFIEVTNLLDVVHLIVITALVDSGDISSQSRAG